jgi:hypothetical protein
VKQADGGDLTAEETVQSVWCVGYVSGILDGLAIMRWKGGTTPVCLPTDGVENEQAVRIVVKFLRENPKMLHETGRSLVVAALGEAFACPSAKRPPNEEL